MSFFASRMLLAGAICRNSTASKMSPTKDNGRRSQKNGVLDPAVPAFPPICQSGTEKAGFPALGFCRMGDFGLATPNWLLMVVLSRASSQVHVKVFEKS